MLQLPQKELDHAQPFSAPSSSHVMAWSKAGAWDPKLCSQVSCLSQAGQMESIQPAGPAELSFVLVPHEVHISLEKWWSLSSGAGQFGIPQAKQKGECPEIILQGGPPALRCAELET